jgi:hypothetical protein
MARSRGRFPAGPPIRLPSPPVGQPCRPFRRWRSAGPGRRARLLAQEALPLELVEVAPRRSTRRTWRADRAGGTSASGRSQSRLRPCRRPCRASRAELWPREANLALAQAHTRGGSDVTIAQQLNRQRGSSASASNLTRKSQATVQESWQPDPSPCSPAPARRA